MNNEDQTTIEDITALNLNDEVFKDPDFMPPKEKTILAPNNGWQESTYYIVEAAFDPHNPIHRYVFFSGFLSKGIPNGYNEFFRTQGLEYKSAHYLKPLFIIAKHDIHKGATPVKEK